MSARGIFTPLLRATFVKGEVTTGTPTDGFVACGDGTAFPMLVTLKQLEEIMYRVKDAWFTGGNIAWISSSSVSDSVYASTTAPAHRSYIERGTFIFKNQRRGYSTDTINPFVGPAYDRGDGNLAWDISDSEYGMFTNSGFGSFSPFEYGSFNQNDVSPGSDWWSRQYEVVVDISNRVAVVRVSPTDGFFAPTNKFYLELNFYISWGMGYGYVYGSTNASYFGDSSLLSNVCRYVIRLSPCDGSNDISCPFYFGPSEEVSSPTASDFIHKAKEWWPYAKDSPPTPVWSSTTGAKL